MFRQNINRQLFYLFLCNLAIVFIGMGLFPILPLYAMEFGATPTIVGLFMASTYASISGGSLIATRLAAYLGRKRLFIASGLLSLPAVFLLGQVTALWQIVVLTNVLWFAGGVGQAMTAVFTGLTAASDSRGKSFSLLHLSSPLAATFILIARSVSSSVGAALTTDLLAPEELGRGLAWLSTAGWITGMVAFAGAGHVIETWGATTLYLMVAALALVAALQLRRIRYRTAEAAVVFEQSIAAYQPTLPANGSRLRLAGLWRLMPIMSMGLLISGCLPLTPDTPPTGPATAHAPLVTAVASPTLAASATPTTTAEATAVQESPTATATATLPPQANQPERIVFTPGSSSVTINNSLPGQSQKVYLLWAAAGQTVRISVHTPDNSVLFHLHGQEDGVDYKHLLDGEMDWQGVLPVSQEYVLTLDALGDDSRSYTLQVQLITETTLPPDNGGGPLHPVVDGATGYLLGGWHNNGWVDAATYAPLISDVERPYRLYNLQGEAGVADGAPPLSQGICLQPHVSLTPIVPGTVGLVSRWSATPRLPTHLATDNATYRQAVAEALQNAGLSNPEVYLDQVLRVDLEGDGVDEVLLVASRMAAAGQPSVAAGDYAVVLLRQVVGNEVITRPLYLDVYPQDVELAFPWRYEIVALADLNGNGRLEIVVAANRYEGRQVTVFEVQNSGAQTVLQAGCTQ